MSCLDQVELNRFQILLIAASLAPPERAACVLCSISYAGGSVAVLKQLITAVFAISSPSWAETRQKAWEANFGMMAIDLDDGQGSTVSFYLLDQRWIDDLAGHLEPGGVIPQDCTVFRRFE